MGSSSFDITLFDVRDLDFEDLVVYWKYTNHFNDAKKIYKEVVKKLGPYQCNISFPAHKAYGLYHNNTLVGATQIMQWDYLTVRFRTINILPEYRGNGLGWHLIDTAIKRDWNKYEELFGWMSLRRLNWAIKNEFEVQIESNSGTHVGVFKKLK